MITYIIDIYDILINFGYDNDERGMPMNKTKKLYTNLQKNIDTIKQMNGNSCDINSRIIHFKKIRSHICISKVSRAMTK